MSDRNRPPKDERLGSKLAEAVLRGAQAEARSIAEKIAERDTDRRQREERERHKR